jgi:hypothetical protein
MMGAGVRQSSSFGGTKSARVSVSKTAADQSRAQTECDDPTLGLAEVRPQLAHDENTLSRFERIERRSRV